MAFHVIMTRSHGECYWLKFDGEMALRCFLRKECVDEGWDNDITIEDAERAGIVQSDDGEENRDEDEHHDEFTYEGRLAALTIRVRDFETRYDWRNMDVARLVEVAIEIGNERRASRHNMYNKYHVGVVFCGDVLGSGGYI